MNAHLMQSYLEEKRKGILEFLDEKGIALFSMGPSENSDLNLPEDYPVLLSRNPAKKLEVGLQYFPVRGDYVHLAKEVFNSGMNPLHVSQFNQISLPYFFVQKTGFAFDSLPKIYLKEKEVWKYVTRYDETETLFSGEKYYLKSLGVLDYYLSLELSEYDGDRWLDSYNRRLIVPNHLFEDVIKTIAMPKRENELTDSEIDHRALIQKSQKGHNSAAHYY